jgi:hypothetical protein
VYPVVACYQRVLEEENRRKRGKDVGRPEK